MYDSTGRINKKHARKVLAAYTERTKIDTKEWIVKVFEHAASGMAQQTDNKSCGVFMAVTALHLMADAKLPNVQRDIVMWRRYLAIHMSHQSATYNHGQRIQSDVGGAGGGAMAEAAVADIADKRQTSRTSCTLATFASDL